MSAPHPLADPLQHAIDLAEGNVAEGGGPFGAVLVSGDGTWVSGVNRVTRLNDPTAHAEIEAIRTAAQRLGNEDLSGHVLYASCEPCPMCLAAAMWARIDEVVFAASASDAAAAGFDDAMFREELCAPEPRVIRVTRARRPGEQAPFEAWERQPGRDDY